ncbi:acetolactate synthase [Aspergillus clavatus NRRL 1]|uniref:Acetolactate synthase n=1 Tax=Aspergillus clavatus (strain ATCC 1007 / CBS 513.65 / DSM 816 / NCTC 3887 / NRRL 1 / QM 1276 / 107) TaxID=344612 RepID=A1CMZ4_ASPCL|nr:acetolactate synthase [Aspergillus clavatus NRRL 1]EAW08931.1 acetolactate synthase [Aspergillus clavatus NRRL 1]
MKVNKFLGLTGGGIVREELIHRRVEYVFGYPGGAALPLFDALHNNRAFEFILSRHEQGAGHMAEGYARVSGQPGVLLVTSGPGSSNLVTPMLDALLDGTPLVVFCGQVSTAVQVTGAFQEIEIMKLAKTCTKWCGLVQDISELPACIEAAFQVATSGRPGPTLVAIPKDIGLVVFDELAFQKAQGPPLEVPACIPQWGTEQLEDSINRVGRLINLAERPIIICGQGVLSTAKGPALVDMLLELVQMPVATTLLGTGAVDELRPEALGMVGTYGTVPANLAVQEADLVLALGARLDERAVGHAAGFAPAARDAATRGCGGIVHFDIDRGSVGKVVEPTVTVLGDLCISLVMLLQRVAARSNPEWFQRIQRLKRKHPFQYQPSPMPRKMSARRLLPQAVIAELDAQTTATKQSTIITTGVGQHQMWAARYYQWRTPRSLITSGALGTMGFGLPAAIGAKLARPDCTVLDVDGDASLCMTMEEMLTAVQFGVEIKILIINNGEQGMIKQLQNTSYEGRVVHAHQVNPDFVRLAQSMGCKGRRCDSKDDLAASVRWLLQTEGVVLLEVVTEGNVPMVPIVPTGQPLDAIVKSLPTSSKSALRGETPFLI